MLIPVIKITYLLILLLITLLYSLCYNEFEKFIVEQNNKRENCDYLFILINLYAWKEFFTVIFQQY